MSGKGKISCWHAFNNAEFFVHGAFGKLGHVPLEDSTKNAIERYVCLLYQPGTTIDRLTELRWWMFRRKQAESNKLPPTKAAFLESIERSQYQCIIWKTATDALYGKLQLNLFLLYRHQKIMVGNEKVTYLFLL